MGIVLTAIRTHSNDSDVVNAACKAATYLSRNDVCMQQLRDSDIHEILISMPNQSQRVVSLLQLLH